MQELWETGNVPESMMNTMEDSLNKREWIEEKIEDWLREAEERFPSTKSPLKDPIPTPRVMDSTSQQIYALGMGETLELTNFTKLTRVPGGWIYSEGNKDPAFIPFSLDLKFPDKIRT